MAMWLIKRLITADFPNLIFEGSHCPFRATFISSFLRNRIGMGFFLWQPGCRGPSSSLSSDQHRYRSDQNQNQSVLDRLKVFTNHPNRSGSVSPWLATDQSKFRTILYRLTLEGVFYYHRCIWCQRKGRFHIKLPTISADFYNLDLPLQLGRRQICLSQCGLFCCTPTISVK